MLEARIHAAEGRYSEAVQSCQLAEELGATSFRPFLLGVRATDPMVDYLPAVVESLRGTILGKALMSEGKLSNALATCRAHLRNPDVVFTSYTVAQVWGRMP